MSLRIGLEVHVYPSTESKMHCACSTGYLDAQPNSLVCEVCTSQPGSKPWGVNRQAVIAGVRAGKLLGCVLNSKVKTLRKHYFYPDLPSGYQRTSTPVGENGVFEGVRVRELHWEEDPGQYDERKALVDYNRSGVPLLEIVTEPDMRSALEARAFMEKLFLALKFNGLVKDEANFKADVNVSIDSIDGSFGNRVEVKNVNSIKSMVKAIEFEEKRQRALAAEGRPVVFETRHFDDLALETRSAREKESAEDYRYLPDPDLPSVPLQELVVQAPLNPFQLRDSLVKEFGIEPGQALTIVVSGFEAQFREVALKVKPTIAASFYASLLKGELDYRGSSTNPLKDEFVVQVISRFEKGGLTQLGLSELVRNALDGKTAVVGGVELEPIVLEVLVENPEVVEKYKSGKGSSLDYLLGQVVKKAGRTCDVKRARELLKEKLS